MKLIKFPSKLSALCGRMSEKKSGAMEYVRRKCDDIPPQKRFRIVAVAFAIFALLAIFSMGRAVYNIYSGVHTTPDTGRMKHLPMPEKGDVPTIQTIYGLEENDEQAVAPDNRGGTENAD